MYTDVNREIYM